MYENNIDKFVDKHPIISCMIFFGVILFGSYIESLICI